MNFSKNEIWLERRSVHPETVISDSVGIVVQFHCPTPRQTQKPRKTQILINEHRTEWESALTSVYVQYQHLHIILWNLFFLSASVSDRP